MSSKAQIAANQQNAKKSTGPITPAGAAASSKNATKHGLTGQTLIVSPEERDTYQAHVQSYMDTHNPTTQEHRQLVQQLADAHWSIHQIFVLQYNAMALMSAISNQMSEIGDPIATVAALAPVTRQLNTYSIYEGRKRRAAKEIQEELAALEQQITDQKSAAAPTPEPKIGFDHSAAPKDDPQDRQSALLDRINAGLTPEEEEEILKELYS